MLPRSILGSSSRVARVYTPILCRDAAVVSGICFVLRCVCAPRQQVRRPLTQASTVQTHTCIICKISAPEKLTAIGPWRPTVVQTCLWHFSAIFSLRDPGCTERASDQDRRGALSRWSACEVQSLQHRYYTPCKSIELDLSKHQHLNVDTVPVMTDFQLRLAATAVSARSVQVYLPKLQADPCV